MSLEKGETKMNIKFVKAVVKELRKHSELHNCYGCKQLLRELAKLLNISEEKMLGIVEGRKIESSLS